MDGPHQGYLKLIIGPMFSGKSTSLAGILTKFADRDYKVLYLNHSSDVRECAGQLEDTCMTTHGSSMRKLSNKINKKKVHLLTDLRNIDDYDIIGVDESGFFSDLVEQVVDWVDNKRKYVIVVGLDGSSERSVLGDTLDLIPHCNEVTKLLADCEQCRQEMKHRNFHGDIMVNNAPFTACIIDKTGEFEVGGADKYQAMCRYHHLQHLDNKKRKA